VTTPRRRSSPQAASSRASTFGTSSLKNHNRSQKTRACVSRRVVVVAAAGGLMPQKSDGAGEMELTPPVSREASFEQAREAVAAVVGTPYKLNPVVTHSLKAPGFNNTGTHQVIKEEEEEEESLSLTLLSL
jgi:hypothetical protein